MKSRGCSRHPVMHRFHLSPQAPALTIKSVDRCCSISYAIPGRIKDTIIQPSPELRAQPSNPVCLNQSSQGRCCGRSTSGEMNRDTRYRSTVDVSETFKPVEGSLGWALDQQEVPALHLHNVSPGYVVCFTSTRT